MLVSLRPNDIHDMVDRELTVSVDSVEVSVPTVVVSYLVLVVTKTVVVIG